MRSPQKLKSWVLSQKDAQRPFQPAHRTHPAPEGEGEGSGFGFGV